MDTKMSIKQDAREAFILGWGPRRWRGADSLRSLDRLGTLSEVEGLAVDHHACGVIGVTAQCKMAPTSSKGDFCEVIK